MSKTAAEKSTQTAKTTKTTKPKAAVTTARQGKPLEMTIQRALQDPSGLSSQEFLQLQGSIGNRAVGSLLQRRSSSNEQPFAHTRSPFPHSRSSIVQRYPTMPVTQQSSAFRLHQSPQNTVQRLITRENFVRLAGAPGTKAKTFSGRKGSTYVQILHKLDKFHAHTNNSKKQTEKLNDLVKLIEGWMTARQSKQEEAEQQGKKDPTDQRKKLFLAGLLLEVKKELGQTIPENSRLPSQGVEFWDEVKKKGASLVVETEKELNENGKRDEKDKNRYIFSVFANIHNRDDLEFIRLRTSMTIENEKQKYLNKTRKKKNKKKIKQSSDIRLEAATSVIESKYSTLENKFQKERIKKLAKDGGSSGHTWTKLSVFSPENELVAEHSIGFWPLVGTVGRDVSVPGTVKFPDPADELSQNRRTDDYGATVYRQGIRRRDTIITADGYRKAIKYATDRMTAPPEYNLRNYNCTTFAKFMADAAGSPFPEKSYLAVPSGIMDVVRGVASVHLYSPDELFASLGTESDDFYQTHTLQYGSSNLSEQRGTLEQKLGSLTLPLYFHLTARSRFGKSNPVGYLTGMDLLNGLGDENLMFDDVLSVFTEEPDGAVKIMYTPGGEMPNSPEDAMYAVEDSQFKSFVSAVKMNLKAYKELDQLSQKIPTYIPVPLRKKPPKKQVSLTSESESVSTPTTTTETTVTVPEVSLPKLTDEQIAKRFQHHFRNSNGRLELKTELNLYEDGVNEVARVADEGETLTASMFYGGGVSVEDNNMGLYIANMRELAVAIGWSS